MQLAETRCIRRVGEAVQCLSCKGATIKHGHSAAGKQRYYCKNCKSSFVSHHTYKAYGLTVNKWIRQLVKEGCGIRSIGRLLGISPVTVLKRILSIAKLILRPKIITGKEHELDELCTYLMKKGCLLWVIYALRKDTGEVVDFTVGNRSNEVLNRVVQTLLFSGSKRICTDKLLQYKSLIPASIHDTRRRGTNHIERRNLNLRTHLKRLNRKTICNTKSAAMLSACLKIYFWG